MINLNRTAATAPTAAPSSLGSGHTCVSCPHPIPLCLRVPIGVIQRILGHQNRRTTEIYLHSIGEAEREAMNKLEGIPLFEATPNPDRSAPTNMPMAFWNRKVQRPDHEALKRDIEQMGYIGAGRKYGVSDNAVRKWIRAYERRHHDPTVKRPMQAVRTPRGAKSHTDSHTATKKEVAVSGQPPEFIGSPSRT